MRNNTLLKKLYARLEKEESAARDTKLMIAAVEKIAAEEPVRDIKSAGKGDAK